MADSYRTDLERSILGIVIWDSTLFTRVSASLDAGSFENPQHALLFSTMASLVETGRALDPSVVILELRRRKQIEAAGGAEFISALSADPGASDPRRLDTLVHNLKGELNRIKLINGLRGLIEKGADRGNELTAVLADASATLAEIEYDDDDEELASIASAVAEIREELKTGVDPGTPTCIPTLDDAIQGGMKPGQFIVLAGPTGGGKSALAGQIALRAAQWAQENDRGGILFFSYEMSRKELSIRLLQQATPEMRDGYRAPAGFSNRDMPFVAPNLARIEGLPIHIEDKGVEDVGAVRGAVERHIARTGRKPSLVIVDHMGLIGSAGAKSDTEAMTRVTRSLKNMARILEIPVMGLAQFSRAVDSREDSTPQLSDLKQSSSIEHDANIVLLLHAPYTRLKDKEERKRLVEVGAPVYLHVAKNRSGPTAQVDLEWVGPRVSFREPSAPAPIGGLEPLLATNSETGKPVDPAEEKALVAEIQEALRQLESEPKAASEDALFD